MGIALYCGLLLIGGFLVRAHPIAEVTFWVLLAMQASNAAWTFWQRAHLLAPTLALGCIALLPWGLAASPLLGVPFDARKPGSLHPFSLRSCCS